MEIFEAAKKQETRKESIMKTSIMKRMIGCAMTVILVISLSAGILAQAVGRRIEGDANNRLFFQTSEK